MSLIFIPPVSRRTDCPLGGTTPTSYLLAIFLSSEIFANFPRRFNYCIKSAPNTRYSIYKKAHAPPCIGACARPHACRGSGRALPRRAAPILSARLFEAFLDTTNTFSERRRNRRRPGECRAELMKYAAARPLFALRAGRMAASGITCRGGRLGSDVALTRAPKVPPEIVGPLRGE